MFRLLAVAAVAVVCATAPVAAAADPFHDALMTLFEDFGGHGWVNNDGWGSSSNYCTWYGVSCNGGGQPEKLKLRNNGLVGFFTNGIAPLNASLTWLDLGNNHIMGNLPSCLTSFGVMSSLYLDANHINVRLCGVDVAGCWLLFHMVAGVFFLAFPPPGLPAGRHQQHVRVEVHQRVV